jgi:hypothetical protein
MRLAASGISLAVIVLGLVWWRSSGGRTRSPSGAPSRELVEEPPAARPAAAGATPPAHLPASSARAALETAPEALAPPFRVRVRSVVSFAKDAPRVPDVAFQILPRHEDPPLPELSVRSLVPPIPLVPGDSPIHEGSTDAHGEALIGSPRTKPARARTDCRSSACGSSSPVTSSRRSSSARPATSRACSSS